MSTNFTGSEPDLTTAPSDSLFAATPVWDRASKKKRGFGSKTAKTAAPVTVSETLVETRPTYVEKAPTAEQIAARELRAERLRDEPIAYREPIPATTAGVEAPLVADTTPIYATRAAAAKRSSSMAPLAVGAGILVLGGLAAAGWYATRDDGVTTLTPGSTSTAALETATTPISPAPIEVAANEQVAPAVTQTTTTVRAEAPARRVTTSTTRTRPAPAASATDAGVNTAAIPSAPMPYAATTGESVNTSATAPTTVNPGNFVLTPAPAPAAAEPSATPFTSAVPPTATPPVAS
ncbi:MAG: hypothetical protein ABW360_08685, partial [Phenylobacterium sp.]